MKNIIYSVIIACLAVTGFTSCNPQESDDHSLGGMPIQEEALSWNVVQNENTFTFTNTSKEQAGVNYYVSKDGKKLTEFPVNSSFEYPVKANGTYSIMLYAFSACDQKNLVWTKEVDWIKADDDKQWLGFTAGKNLVAETKPILSFWFADGGWGQVADPQVEGDLATGYTLVKSETGSSQWQAQMHLNKFGVNLSSSKSYDFSMVIVSSADVEGDGVTVKPQKQDEDGTFLSESRHKIKAGVNVITLTDCAGFDGELKLAMDFAGMPAGAVITVKNIYVAEHDAANVSPEGGDTWAFDFQSESNLLKGAAHKESFYFADNGWVQIANPEIEGNTSEYSLTIPAATGTSQWQGQVHLVFEDVVLKAAKNYDFSLVVIADNDMPGMTVKPQKNGDDGTFFSEARYHVKANTPTAITLPANAGFDGVFKLCMDFGGAPGGTKVRVLGVYLGEHK